MRTPSLSAYVIAFLPMLLSVLFLARAVLMDKSVAGILLFLSRVIALYILSIILNASFSQMDSKIPLLCSTHLFKVVHISLKYLHTSLFGCKWPDIPDPHCKFKQTKQNSYQTVGYLRTQIPENPAEIRIISMTDAISWVEKDQHGTMLLDKPFFFF